ncbi:MAG: SGNH/GDSL hydrolase family protein [Algibacter sp.]|uniref:SGNH/GDSL hydrolase family protein n=1 Tax=Algibacter sp. TaxID=1872428 RepID=UPI0026066428|nr:SGNH/GDSL hydrolase family protein [Algibacter sp.]MDG1729267.1 SGNH/GDSL hydrolase family protein [Algibacter sp.]MDG2178986.1 SGNH/GDSL hydrolase family protein [Algibacter sp.]
MVHTVSKYFILITFVLSFVFHAEGQINKETYNLLFIGNSLTSTNNLPLIIKTKAKYSGYNIETEMITLPNYAISDHWKKGEVQNLIRSKKYDVVIIQQGPSSQSKGRQILIDYGKKYNAICKENKALLAYFMVWPSLQNYDTFDDVIKNYEIAAVENDAILCPVGKHWKHYFESSKKFDYYGVDNFHPSKKGSEVAAKIILNNVLKHLRQEG